MLEPGERVLVAVSGGKDSLALWDILVRLGYEADGLYLGLGIGDYSDESGEYTRAFAAKLGRPLREVDLAREYGYGIPEAAEATRRSPCGVVRALQAPPLQLGRARARVRRSSRPGTTSTTKPPSSSATSCAGRPATWAVSTPCCPRRRGSCGR